MWYKKEVEEARKNLLEYYNSLQSSQNTRLIGFVAGLFTLLQLTQVSETSTLHVMFPNFPVILNLPIEAWQLIRFIILSGGTAIIVFYIIRAIFRFSVFGYYSSAIACLTKKYFEKAQKQMGEDEDNLGPTHLMNVAASIFLMDNKSIIKVYGIFPVDFFIKFNFGDYRSRESWGKFWLTIISLAVTILILIVIW